ncbi:MAG: hypothetical protein RLO50_05865 [Azospirillaceae bacterium]
MPDDLIPALFALATVVAERLHDTAIAGQDAGIDPGRAEELAQRLKQQAADIDALASAILVANDITSSDLRP